MKEEVKTLDGTPDKRLFWSIISDYDIKTALCELVDNAIDTHSKTGIGKLQVNITLDAERQLIKVEDNAGGVDEKDLVYLISPGGSKNNPDEEVIGFFGVGTKRAVVALAQEVKILSRRKTAQTFQIDIDENWLANDSWELPVYKVDDIKPNSTIVDLSKLRIKVTDKTESDLSNHFSETYAFFIFEKKLEIRVNQRMINPSFFSSWAFPPKYEPRNLHTILRPDDGFVIDVQIEGGLNRSKQEGEEEYGVYFYCNNRLIAKELKDREVGFISGYAGIPHSDASLARVIVMLKGPAKHMPWNSSKSEVNYGHPTFKALEKVLFSVVKDYTSLSRRFKGFWEEKVFKYDKGIIAALELPGVQDVEKSYLPPLPMIKKRHVEKLRAKNKKVIFEKPWTLGLIEAIAAVDLIRHQRFETKNRMALILLDSNFEIALKEFIVHRTDLELNGRSLKKIFDDREEVIKIVEQKIILDHKTKMKIKHFYQMRNKLIHEKATLDVTDSDIENYAKTTQKILTSMFALVF